MKHCSLLFSFFCFAQAAFGAGLQGKTHLRDPYNEAFNPYRNADATNLRLGRRSETPRAPFRHVLSRRGNMLKEAIAERDASDSEIPQRNSQTERDHEFAEGSPDIIMPKLRLEVRDLDHPGAIKFQQAVDIRKIVRFAIKKVTSILYGSNSAIPAVRSLTIVLDPASPDLAYTVGNQLDPEHKEIHFALDYIDDYPGDLEQEILGVMVHEMAHVWQWGLDLNGHRGLTEGIADFVRLKAGLDPPHWADEVLETWDQGYAGTAYFLDWLEKSQAGSVKRLNNLLRNGYDRRIWRHVYGASARQLYRSFRADIGRQRWQ